MTTTSTVQTPEGLEQNLASLEKAAKNLKPQKNQSEPFWKRNLSKSSTPKKIGGVSRAKGGRH